MKFAPLAVALASAVSLNAFAACTSTTQVTDVTGLLGGSLVQGSFGGDSWNEQHYSGGDLWDLKRGANDPVDPSERVGSWSAGGIDGDTVIYNYLGGSSYSYKIYSNTNGTYCFDGSEFGGETIDNITITGSSVNVAQ